MKAIILAGGKGMRLRPLTQTRPKPLMRIADRTILDIILERLSNTGIKQVGIALGYRGNDIINEIGDSAYGVEVRYFTEDVPLGTAGSVKNCADFLSEDTLILSADTLTDIDFGEMERFHKEKNANLTIATTKRDKLFLYGVINTDGNSKINKIVEKPPLPEEEMGQISCGIYIIKREIMDLVPENTPFDFARDLFPKIIPQGRSFAYDTCAFWSDIGSFSEYKKSNLLTLSGSFFVNPNQLNSVMKGEVKDSVIGKGTRVLEGAKVEKSVIGRNVRIGSFSRVCDCILGDGVTVGENALVKEGSVIGDFAIIGNNAVIDNGKCIDSYGVFMG